MNVLREIKDFKDQVARRLVKLEDRLISVKDELDEINGAEGVVREVADSSEPPGVGRTWSAEIESKPRKGIRL